MSFRPTPAFRFSCAVLALATAVIAAAMPAHADEDVFRDKFIALGTSSRAGTFYSIGSKLCDAVNADREKNLVRCVAYPTVGSEYNVKAVAYGELTLGITRPDIAFGEFSNIKADNSHGPSLRAVMSLHAMPVVIIARRQANIVDVTQLPGHSINIGNSGSGQRSIVDLLLKNFGLKPADFSAVTELHTIAMGEAFCQGKVDVIIETLGNPAPFYRRMIEECNGRIVSIPATMIDKIIAANPLMNRLSIPGGLYAGHPDPIPSLGYKALLVTRKEVSEEAIRRFIGSVMNGLDELKRSDPVLRELDPEKMFTEGVTIPLHPGVANYINNRKTASYADSSRR